MTCTRYELQTLVMASTGVVTAATAILVYCASGMALTLVNKLAIGVFSYPNVLLVLQNGVTTLLVLTLNVTPWFEGKVCVHL